MATETVTLLNAVDGANTALNLAALAQWVESARDYIDSVNHAKLVSESLRATLAAHELDIAPLEFGREESAGVVELMLQVQTALSNAAKACQARDEPRQ